MRDGDNVREALRAGMSESDMELLRALGGLAESRGTSAFVVGGVVRDLLLGRATKDLDVVVEEDAIAFGEAAAEHLGGSVKAHTRFGTVILVTPTGGRVDLATARSEVYERPGALPTVSGGDMRQDQLRRDFTINSMAVSLSTRDFGRLSDPFGGVDDLRNGVLRVMHERSFEDDPTRVLRAVRFAARLDMSIEPETGRLLRRAVDERRLDTVSGERILNELRLILSEPDPLPPVRRMVEWDVFRSIDEAWAISVDVETCVREALVLLAAERGKSGACEEEAQPLDRGSASGELGVSEPRESAPGVIEVSESDESARGELEVSEFGRNEIEDWVVLLAVLLEPLSEADRLRIADRLSSGRRLTSVLKELAAIDSVGPGADAEERMSDVDVYHACVMFSRESLIAARACSPGTPKAKRIARYLTGLSRVTTEITGEHVIGLGVHEGPRVGKVLQFVLNAKIEDRSMTLDDERRLAAEFVRGLTLDDEAASVPRDTVDGNPEEAVDDNSAREHRGNQTATVADADTEPTENQEPAESAQESPPIPQKLGGGEDGPVSAGTGENASVLEEGDEKTLVRRPVYEVHIDAFEGPLDLLLHLIREHEIDIYDIPIAKITEQYLEYINFMESLDLSLAGEFLEMAATLIRIKVQMLLPSETEDGEEEEDPRDQLVRKLVEYKKFKEAASALSEKEEERRQYFPRGVDPRSYADIDEEEIGIDEFLRDVTLFDLVDGLREVLSRVPERVDVHSVDMEEVTVEQQIDRIRAVIGERGSIPFLGMFQRGASRFEIVATFIALLELIRLGEVRATQKSNFGDIEIVARAEE